MKSNKFKALLKDNKGATMVEYAILLFLILVLAAAIYKQVGQKVQASGQSTQAAFQ
jgi:Flp pilus assembly pilin Flp